MTLFIAIKTENTTAWLYCFHGGLRSRLSAQFLKDNGLDIERMANHRGSSFGKLVTPQPSQIGYENQLAVEILKISRYSRAFVLEDESKAVGAHSVPLPLFNSMSCAPMVVIDDPLELRHQLLCYEHCTAMSEKFSAAFAE